MIVFNVVGLTLNFLPSEGVTQIILLLACSTLSYFSFRQPTLYRQPKTIEVPEKPEEDHHSKYQRLIPENEKKKLLEELETYLNEEKPFLNPSIRMPDLAQSLGVSTNVFSYLINEHYKMNFFSFINQHRINYSMELLKSPEHRRYTLETISEMSGFKSKSSFYRRFKEVIGQSPGEYQKEHLKVNSQ